MGEDMKEVARRLELEERRPDLFDIVPYKPVEPKVKMPMLPYEERRRNFRLIEMSYLREPNKCINCTQCVRVCHDVIGPDCYGMFGKGFDTIVSTPFNVSLHDTDCVSCGACVQVCPPGSLMMAERHLTRYAFALDRCSFCVDCVEVCPHG